MGSKSFGTMSKSIILTRHAKSSWAHDVSDHERPLKSRGKTDAALVAEDFKTYNIDVDKVYSSSAKRALNTCFIMHDTLDWPTDAIEIEPQLYDFAGEQVIQVIKNLPETYETVMIFGHNHALTSISNIFGDRYIDNLPTSGMVKLNFDSDNWSSITKGTTEFIIIPKPLRHE